jgi:hypothetical protein
MSYAVRLPMSRSCIRQIAAAAAGAVLFAACGWAQSQYRVVTPDGKVLYTDRPPASAKGARVTEVKPKPRSPAAPKPRAARDAPARVEIDYARHYAEAQSAGYRACVSSRPRAVRLATLSRELVENREWLARAEISQDAEERSPAGLDREQARAALKQQFADYRKAGGQAARAEDVQSVPDPCAGISAAGSAALK